MLNNDQIKSGQITLGVFPGIWASKNIQILPQRRVPGAPAGDNFVKVYHRRKLDNKTNRNTAYSVLHSS